ncbi:unnamed protein product, partial [Polarella glacialis]
LGYPLAKTAGALGYPGEHAAPSGQVSLLPASSLVPCLSREYQRGDDSRPGSTSSLSLPPSSTSLGDGRPSLERLSLERDGRPSLERLSLDRDGRPSLEQRLSLERRWGLPLSSSSLGREASLPPTSQATGGFMGSIGALFTSSPQ